MKLWEAPESSNTTTVVFPIIPNNLVVRGHCLPKKEFKDKHLSTGCCSSSTSIGKEDSSSITSNYKLSTTVRLFISFKGQTWPKKYFPLHLKQILLLRIASNSSVVCLYLGWMPGFAGCIWLVFCPAPPCNNNGLGCGNDTIAWLEEAFVSPVW